MAAGLAHRATGSVVLAYADGDTVPALDLDETMRAAAALRCPLVVLVTHDGAGVRRRLRGVPRRGGGGGTRPRAGGGPALVRATTAVGETLPDALAALAARARATGVWSDADERDARASARRAVDEAAVRAKAAFDPNAGQLAERLYYSMPPRLAAQVRSATSVGPIGSLTTARPPATGGAR